MHSESVCVCVLLSIENKNNNRSTSFILCPLSLPLFPALYIYSSHNERATASASIPGTAAGLFPVS